MKLGFIGLGRMGAGMAANLLKGGHDLSVFNRSSGKSGPLIALGAHEVNRIADACRGEAIITMLADDDAASAVAFADGGLIASVPKGAIHISMSSISVALSKRLALAHAQAGQRYIAAPVFGRPDMAASAIMPMLLKRCRRRRPSPPRSKASCVPLGRWRRHASFGRLLEGVGERNQPRLAACHAGETHTER